MLEISRTNTITVKLIALAILMIISFVASVFVMNLVQEREGRKGDAISKTGEQWSGAQAVFGPVLTVPVERFVITPEGKSVAYKNSLVLLPKELIFQTDVSSQVLKRGIYDIPVYTATVKGSGSFDLSVSDKVIGEGWNVLWDEASVSINVSDTRGVASLFDLHWDENTYQFMPASEFSLPNGNGVHVAVAVNPADKLHFFTFSMPLRGSEEILFMPLGEKTEVNMRSDWNAPNFKGAFLPLERALTHDGFTATWEVASYGKNLPQAWFNDQPVESNTLFSKSFGVSFHQEVDFYTMVNRATKYAILFICLTFLAFFMYEVLAGLRIHPIQYLLVGFSLALFYLLLLSLSEIIGFLSAYIISTVATTTMISGYSFSVLKARRRALSIAALLLALYAYLYVLLQLDAFSLLFGSVLLFSVLASVMYFTRNIDWYSLKN